MTKSERYIKDTKVYLYKVTLFYKRSDMEGVQRCQEDIWATTESEAGKILTGKVAWEVSLDGATFYMDTISFDCYAD